MLPVGSTPRPWAGSHPAPARGWGTNPALFSPLRPPGRDEVTGPGIKSGFLGPGRWGRAGLGARSRVQAGYPCLRTPKTTQVFINSLYRFGAISGHRSQPCCQQLKIFWEGGTETRGKASRDGRRKKIRGRTTGRKRAGANAAPFPPQPCPDPSGKGVTLPPPPSPSPRAGTGHKSLYFWHQRGEIEAQTLTLRAEFGDLKLSAGVSSEAHHRSVWAPCIGLVFFPASPGAADEEKPLEMAPKPNLMAIHEPGDTATQVARTQGRAVLDDAGPESISWECSPPKRPQLKFSSFSS